MSAEPVLHVVEETIEPLPDAPPEAPHGRSRSGLRYAAAALAGLIAGVLAIAPWTVPGSKAERLEQRALAAEADVEDADVALEDAGARIDALEREVAGYEEEVDQLEGSLASTQTERDEALDTAAQLGDDVAALERTVARREEDVSRLEGERDGALAAAEQELADDRAAMDADFAARSAALDAREAAISAAEDIAERSTFTSGRWRVGTDVVPGRYVAQASSGCYWARLSGSGDDIIDNEFLGESGQTIATLREGELFESSGCGTWNREA